MLRKGKKEGRRGAGEGKIRKEHPVLPALAVLPGCTLKLTKHLIPGTACVGGTKNRKGQMSLFTLQRQHLGEAHLSNCCPTESLSPLPSLCL